MYFIKRDKYKSFTENPKENNIVNQISIPVATVLQDKTEEIVKTGNKQDVSWTDASNTYYSYYYSDMKDVSYSLSYQSSFDEVNKYGGLRYRVRGLRFNSHKNVVDYWQTSMIGQPIGFKDTITVVDSGYGAYETDENGIIISFGKPLSDITDDDYDIIQDGLCDITSTYLVSKSLTFTQNNIGNYEKPFITQEQFKIKGSKPSISATAGTTDKIVYKTTKDGYQSCYIKIFVEFYGYNVQTQTTDVLFTGEIKNGIIFKESIDTNLLVQNKDVFKEWVEAEQINTYKDIPLTTYLSNTILDNYNYGRGVAELEWQGSPEVTYGTLLRVEPRQDYNIDDLPIYIVIGKKISYDGGYKEVLTLAKKAVDNTCNPYTVNPWVYAGYVEVEKHRELKNGVKVRLFGHYYNANNKETVNVDTIIEPNIRTKLSDVLYATYNSPDGSIAFDTTITDSKAIACSFRGITYY